MAAMLVSVGGVWVNPDKILYVTADRKFDQNTKRWHPTAVVHFGEGDPLVVERTTADQFVDRLTTGIREQGERA